MGKKKDDFTWLVTLWEGKRDKNKPKSKGASYSRPTFSDPTKLVQRRHRQTAIIIIYLAIMFAAIILPRLLRA